MLGLREPSDYGLQKLLLFHHRFFSQTVWVLRPMRVKISPLFTAMVLSFCMAGYGTVIGLMVSGFEFSDLDLAVEWFAQLPAQFRGRAHARQTI